MVIITKESIKKSWRKLDNTAKIFSLDDKKNTNIFRYSVILKENVDINVLTESLKNTLNEYLVFKVKIGTGLFWNYLEFNPKDPIIKEENEIPCEHINFKENNDYLFKVTYYKNKINLDVFHALTDGGGAIKFFKAIIYNYLDLKNNVNFSFEKNNNINVTHQDQYIKNYKKTSNDKMNLKKAFILPQRVQKNINNTYHYIIDINEIKSVCKKYNATITEYLTAIYIYAMYLSFCNDKTKKEIVITIPIDLRKYYNVETLSNFFVCMNINPKILEKKLKNFDDVLIEVQKEFKDKLNKERIDEYLNRDVKLGTNITIRLVPLFIKKLFIKYLGRLVSKSATSTLSNLGIIDIDDQYKKYIENILILVMPGRIQKIKCTICSFDKHLNVTTNANIDDEQFQNIFFNLFKEHLKKVELMSNVLGKEDVYAISKDRKKED